MSSTQTSFFDNLVAAARENPLAAALIGGGALWLLAGDDKLKSAARSTAAAASTMVDSGTSSLRAAASSTLERTVAPPTAPEMDHEGSFGVADAMRAAARSASDALSGTTDAMRNRFDESVGSARESFTKLGDQLPGSEAVAKAQSSLADMLEKQPLVLGVIGLAIGAAVAGAFRTSDIENQYVGPISDDVKADLNTRVGAVSKAVRENSDTLVAEMGDTGAEALDRIKQAGIDAVQAARETAKSP